MKLILKEYLASLKERGELDAIMPDLLSEIGLSVLSKPSIGTRQYGVDVAAVGTDSDGVRKIFLVSIKSGDLKRRDWDVGEQSLRTSLNEIRDVYVPKLIPNRYRNRPVVIALCFGGDLHEDVRTDVEGYIDRNTDETVTFQIWNGDLLADLLLSGVLRENALPTNWRSDFRKAVALVDEPDVSFGHFCRFLSNVANACKKSGSARLTAIRQIYLGLWTLYVWAREAENTEAAYLCSERALLVAWSLVKDHLSGKSKATRDLKRSMDRLIDLHGLISEDYIVQFIEPRAQTLHGLTSAVPSHAYLDKNLKLFDLVGRVGIRGLWLLHLARILDRHGNKGAKEAIRGSLERVVEILEGMIRNNPILHTPLQDSQAIDINIACLFLHRLGRGHTVQHWVDQAARATVFAFQIGGPYPCVYNDYRDLVDHPKADAAYRTQATIGSLLVPTLAVWAAITADTETLGFLAEFTSGPFSHSTLQVWYPGSDTETHLYVGSDNHGLVATDVRIQRSCADMLSPIKSECAATTAFSSLSAVKSGIWPLVLLASRHHRVPAPPHFWQLP